MKKLLTALVLLFAASRAYALQVGDMTITGNLYADQLEVSTFNAVSEIRYQDGSVQYTALQSTGSIVFIQSTQTITGAKTFTSTLTVKSDLIVNGTSYMSGNLNMQNHYVTGVSTPVNQLDAVNKTYADNLFLVLVATKQTSLASTSSSIWTNLVSTFSFTLPSGSWSVQGTFNATFTSANGNVVAYFRMVINGSEMTGASNIANQAGATRSSHISLTSFESLSGGTYNVYVDWASPNAIAITQDPSVWKRVLILNAERTQ